MDDLSIAQQNSQQNQNPRQIQKRQLHNLQQKKVLRCMPSMHCAVLHLTSGMKQSFDSRLCARQLMNYIYHQR